MLKLVVGVLAGSLAVSSAGARATIIGPEASACAANAAGPAMLVHVEGLKSRTGSIRVQSYGGDPGRYFDKGSYQRRIETPLPAAGEVEICVPVPAAGTYAISVRHDVDGSGGAGLNDGGGMSGNPRMSFWDVVRKRKPDPRIVQVAVHGVVRVPIVMNYVHGNVVRPARHGDALMVSVALLSNPRSTGNRSLLPRVRSFCAAHSDIFHYEVETVDQIGEALRIIARVQPKILVVNGGDGTVQAALTELYLGGHFEGAPPPVAVLPNGKTNLIALDLGAVGDPIEALKRVMEIARTGVEEHVVVRELIALSGGSDGRPVLGMFLGGAGLADSILYCRNKIYPLGLPNGISHLLTAFAVLFTMMLGLRAAFLPPRARPLKVSMMRQGQLQGSFSLLIVTTLHRLLLGSCSGNIVGGSLQMILVDHRPIPLLRAIILGIFGRFGRSRMDGIHIERGDEIHIEGDRSSVILDGEIYHAVPGSAIVLKPTPPVSFLRLAA